jgi:hypothetical protein
MTINRINYLHEFIEHDICIFNNTKTTIFNFSDIIEIKQFLSNLAKDKYYITTFELVLNFDTYNSDGPVVNLSKAILLSYNSNPEIINKLIISRINEFIDTYHIDEEFIFSEPIASSCGVIVKFQEISIF